MAIINQVVSGGGTTPTGTKTITTNGTHDVTTYASADVQVPTTAPASYRVFGVDDGFRLKNSTTTAWVPLPANAKILTDYILYEAYSQTPANILSGVIDISTITNLQGSSCLYRCFRYCYGITSIVLSSLEYAAGSYAMAYMCEGATGLVSVDISAMISLNSTYMMQYMFSGCTSLTMVNLKSLIAADQQMTLGYCFNGCTSLITQKFQSLQRIGAKNVMQYCFKGCTSLQSLWFYALAPNSFGSQTTQFNNMLQNVTGCTVHFPIVIQSTIGSWADVTNGFGGTNTTVLFDLVTSLTGADSNTYTRSEKDSTSTATAWTYNDTLYYTSGVSDHTNGVNEPTVGTTIYSDAACTTAVTTVSAIA